MNAAETVFYNKNPLFVGLANYLEKKDLLSDFQEKIANLQVLKRVKLEEYNIVFDELNQARAKRKTLIQLYLKIGRCVYYINSLTYRLNQYYSTVTPEFFRSTKLPEKTRSVFTAVYYLLDGTIIQWSEIEERLCSEEFINRVTNLKSGDITDEKSAFLKEHYLQNPEFKSSITGLSEGLEFLRVLMEWLIALVLFRDYPEQMRDLDELILKVNEDKSALENDEILMRTLVLDIAGQIDSLTFRTQGLQEEIEIALGEESARESIKGHLSNDFVGTYDISEILTRQLNDTHTTDLSYPSTIRLAIESNPKEINLSRSNSADSENKLPPDFKLATFVSKRPEDDYPGRSVSPSATVTSSKGRSKSVIKRNSSEAAIDNQKLFEELEQMKRQLLEDSKKNKNVERPATENVEEHYLKFLNQNQVGPSSEIEQQRKNTGRTDSNFNPDFEQIEVLSVSDNISQNKLNLSRDDSQIQSKYLQETGFSKFDALVRKHKRNQKQKDKEEEQLMTSGISFNPTLILTPQNTQDIGNIDLRGSSNSFIGRATTQGKTISQMEIFERDDALQKIKEKIKNDADFLETLDRHALGSQKKVGEHELGKAVIQSDFTYGRGSNQRRTISGNEEVEKHNARDSMKMQFTSFKNQEREEFELLSPIGPQFGNFRLQMASMDSGERTPQSLGGISKLSVQPLQNEELLAIVDAHKMIKKSAVDFSGIIDGYIEWKFEEFKSEFYRVSSFVFPPKLAEELIRSVSKRNDKGLAVASYLVASQLKSPQKTNLTRKLFKFIIFKRLKTRDETSFKRRDSDAHWGNSTLDVNNSFFSPRESIPAHNNEQQSVLTSPHSPGTPSLGTSNFVPYSPRGTPFVSPAVSIKQTPFMQAFTGQSGGKTVVFQNAVLKNDKLARPVSIVETSFQKKTEAVVAPGPSVKFVNASHGLFAKGVQTPQIKSQLGFVPPLKEQQPVRDLWPKIFEQEQTRPVLRSPPKTLRNSFNEGPLDGSDNCVAVKDHSPGGHVIRNSASTQAGNSTSHGDRSPTSVVVNGKELYLVRVDKEGLVYRSKEDMHK